MRSVADYCGLVTHEHRKPKFLAWIAALVQPFVDLQVLAASLPAAYDLDTAAGAQLDQVGIWIGVTRKLLVPITGVFFAWDTPGVGWNQGQWRGPYQTGDMLFSLGDDDYRLLLKARIASNSWDGTIPGAYDVWEIAFAALPQQFLMLDNQDMSVSIIVIGSPLTNVQRSLLLSGELDLKAAAVRIKGYYFLPRGPIFTWDIDAGLSGGWDQGSWL